MKYKQINLYIKKSGADTFWFNLFSKYCDNLYNDKLIFDKKNLNSTNYISNAYFEKNEKFHTIKNNFTLIYKNYKLSINFYNNESLQKIDNDQNLYLIDNYFYNFNSEWKYLNLNNKIFFLFDESPPRTETNLQLFKNFNNFGLITSSNLHINNKNIFYTYQISLIYFYYLLRLYHLSLDEISVNKKYLIGCYYKKNYKFYRDDIFNKISNISDIKIYSVNYTEDESCLFDLQYKVGWDSNHITSYVDYLKSVCNIIFESNGAYDDFYHCTEKTLKAILFSKLNIIFIYHANYNLVKELINDGYWFLNFEFIDNNKDITDNDVEESILKSVHYLNELYLKFNDNQKVYNYLKQKYETKMQNNYKIFTKLKTTNDLSEEIIKFIIYKFEKPKFNYI